jgi:hypothetical protein
MTASRRPSGKSGGTVPARIAIAFSRLNLLGVPAARPQRRGFVSEIRDSRCSLQLDGPTSSRLTSSLFRRGYMSGAQRIAREAREFECRRPQGGYRGLRGGSPAPWECGGGTWRWKDRQRYPNPKR